MAQRSSDQAYPELSGIPDRATATVLRLLFDRVNSLQGRTGDNPTFRQNLVLTGKRATKLGDPIDDQDAVTLKYLKKNFGAPALRLALQAGGSAPISIVGLPGTDGISTRYGTHSDRLALLLEDMTEGVLFFETDRAALYQMQLIGGTRTWKLVLCRPLRTADPLPSDLGVNDTGFTWFEQTTGVTHRWSGTAWNFYLGSLVDLFANRPDPALADRGFLFIASDRGEHVWRKGSTAWDLLEGVGGPLRGTIAAITTGLTADDAGYLYYATDFDRTYRWTGAAWEDAPGQPMRGMRCYFEDTLLPGSGWALCDGSVVTRSTATGGTVAFTTPNLTGANRFARAVAGATGGTGGSATTHTHPVDPPNTTSTGPSATKTVDQNLDAVTTAVASDAATHDVNIGSFASGTPSGTGGDDALPPYLNERPYIRL